MFPETLHDPSGTQVVMDLSLRRTIRRFRTPFYTNFKWLLANLCDVQLKGKKHFKGREGENGKSILVTNEFQVPCDIQLVHGREQYVIPDRMKPAMIDAILAPGAKIALIGRSGFGPGGRPRLAAVYYE